MKCRNVVEKKINNKINFKSVEREFLGFCRTEPFWCSNKLMQ